MALTTRGSLASARQVSQKELTSLEHEIEMMRDLVHQNIVRYLGTERTDTHLSIFLEYVRERSGGGGGCG